MAQIHLLKRLCEISVLLANKLMIKLTDSWLWLPLACSQPVSVLTVRLSLRRHTSTTKYGMCELRVPLPGVTRPLALLSTC